MLLGNSHYLGNFRFRYLEVVHTANAFALGVDLEHNLRGACSFHSEHGLQNIYDKLHGGIVVIYQYDTVQRRLLQLRPRFFDCQVVIRVMLAIFLVFAHLHI